MNKTVCLIPARSGSKRIPHKNIKDFLGKPIITYPIETAKASGIFDDIIVYTDSVEIGWLALENKVKYEHRIATDTETLTETIMKFIRPDRMDIDYLCVLLPTAVFIDAMELRKTWDNDDLIENCDTQITFCKYSHPIERAFHKNNGKFEMRNSEFEFFRTQDIQQCYYDAGQMYFLNVKSFLKQKRIFMDNIYPIIIDAVDIDNPEDWNKAEAYYKVIHER